MKTRFFAFSILFLTAFTSCERKTEVTFPAQGLHGPNLLVSGSNASITVDQNYSMRADLQKDARLKIVFTNTSNYTGASEFAPRWVTSGENNWNIGSYVNHIQEYSATRRVDKADLAIKFINSPGTAKLDFYVNSNSITRTIMIAW